MGAGPLGALLSVVSHVLYQVALRLSGSAMLIVSLVVFLEETFGG